MHVVTFLSLKGGVGKSTLTSQLSPHVVVLLRRMFGPTARLLVIDADAQSGATITLTGRDPSSFQATIATVLAGQHDLMQATIALDEPSTGLDSRIVAARTGMDLLPSNERAKVRVDAADDLWALHELLHDPSVASANIAMAIIDCGYGDTDLTELAMVAADEIVAAVTPNALDVHGLNLVMRKIRTMATPFPHLKLSGVIVNQVSSYLADEEVLNDLIDQLGPRLWQPYIPHRGSIRRANNQHLPMTAYHPQRPELIALFAALAPKLLPSSTPPGGRHRRTR